VFLLIFYASSMHVLCIFHACSMHLPCMFDAVIAEYCELNPLSSLDANFILVNEAQVKMVKSKNGSVGNGRKS